MITSAHRTPSTQNVVVASGSNVEVGGTSSVRASAAPGAESTFERVRGTPDGANHAKSPARRIAQAAVAAALLGTMVGCATYQPMYEVGQVCHPWPVSRCETVVVPR